MKQALDDLRALILADSNVAALVGTRCYPKVLDPASAMPALTYSQVSGVRLRGLNDPQGMARPRVSIHAWAKTADAAQNLADKVRARLVGFRGVAGATAFASISLENELVDYEAGDAPQTDPPPLFRVIQDYFVHFLEP